MLADLLTETEQGFGAYNHGEDQRYELRHPCLAETVCPESKKRVPCQTRETKG